MAGEKLVQKALQAAMKARAEKYVADPLKRDMNLGSFLQGTKTVNDEGDLFKLYHITKGDFSEFKPGGSNPDLSGPAIWLSANPDYLPASHSVGYPGEYAQGTNVMPVWARMRNPLIVEKGFADKSYGSGFPFAISPEGREKLISEGYDSVINRIVPHGREEYIVLHPEQVKSATGNLGTFDPRSPRIDENRGGEVRNHFQYGGSPLGIRKFAKEQPREKTADRVFPPSPTLAQLNDLSMSGFDPVRDLPSVIATAREVEQPPAAAVPVAAPPAAPAPSVRELTIPASRQVQMPENLSRALWEIYNRTENPADFVRADEQMMRERAAAQTGGVVEEYRRMRLPDLQVGPGQIEYRREPQAWNEKAREVLRQQYGAPRYEQALRHIVPKRTPAEAVLRSESLPQIPSTGATPIDPLSFDKMGTTTFPLERMEAPEEFINPDPWLQMRDWHVENLHDATRTPRWTGQSGQTPRDYATGGEVQNALNIVRERATAQTGGFYRFEGESAQPREAQYTPQEIVLATDIGQKLPRYEEPYFARRDERMPVQTDPIPTRLRAEQPRWVNTESAILDAMSGRPEIVSPPTRERMAASFAQPGGRLTQIEQLGRVMRGDAPEGSARATIAGALEGALGFSPIGAVSNFVEGVAQRDPELMAWGALGSIPGGVSAMRKTVKDTMDRSHRKLGRAEGGQVEDYDKGGAVKKALDFIRAYHGSPHKFDKFDAAKIGTGEGNQSYGHGLYFAGSEDVARGYRDRLSGSPRLQPYVEDRPVDITSPAGQSLLNIERDARFYGFDPARTQNEQMLGNLLKQSGGDADRSRQLSEALEIVRNLQPDRFRVGEVSPGHMYQVRIGARPEQLLDWDKPLYQQNPTIQDMFRKAPENEFGSELPRYLGFRGPGSARKESSALLEAGVPGIKYSDAQTRMFGQGNNNYVVFDPNLIDIERRYATGGEVEGYGPGGSVIKRALQIAEDIGRLKRPGSGYEPIPGAPATVNIPGVGKVEARPVPELEQAASDYMRSVGRPNEHAIERFVPLNEDFARQVAGAFEEMKHDPANPLVRRAYQALADETLAQYRAAKEAGLDIRFLKPGQADPYAASPALGYEDIMNRGRLYVFPTEQGFGSSGGLLATNPLLKGAGRIGDKPDALVNDAFRVVHDLYGHFGPGNPFFRAPGEERAYQLHSRMYSPEARPAAATETRGQNSWVNFGPYGEKNRTALGGDTIYADQKTGLLPDWATELPPEKAGGGAVKRALRAVSDLFGTPEMAKWRGKSVIPSSSMEDRYFHGTSKDKDFANFNVGRHGAWLTKDPAEASQYALENDSMGFRLAPGGGWNMEKTNDASRVIPVFARAENPYTGPLPDFAMALNYKRAQSDWFDQLRSQGHDAWLPENNPNLAVILREPEQIKSAITNTGEFSGPRIDRAEGGEVEKEPGIVERALALLSQLNPIGSAEAGPIDTIAKRAVKYGKQTVRDPQRNAFPGIYGDPREIAANAARQVAPEDPSMKQLFGVTRGDLYEMGQGRQGNADPNLAFKANPRGSEAAENVMTPRNAQRIIDVMTEAQKHEGLRHGMESWYVMDPAYKKLEEIVGPEEARRYYNRLNVSLGTMSPGTEVPTEIQRGLGANYLQEQGRFNDFIRYGGMAENKRGPDFPADIRHIPGHAYHSTAQAPSLQTFVDTGKLNMKSAKVPTYVMASGVPETGFQTRYAVPDAHFTRAIGMSDTRGGEGSANVSMRMSEYQTLQDWWRNKVARETGLEAVPAQALTWGAFSPITGVTSPIGAPKLEMLAKEIMAIAQRKGIEPELARDLVLRGKTYRRGGVVQNALSIAKQQQSKKSVSAKKVA